MSSSEPSLDDRIVLALRRISQAIDVWSRQLWRDYGLTAPQLAALREICSGKNVSPSTIAAALHISQPTVTGILGRLEKRGLIRRERSSLDLRNILAAATEQGAQLANNAPPLLRDRFCHELAKLTDGEQTQILTTLERVATMMHAPEISEAPFFFHEPDTGKSTGSRRPKQRATKSQPQGDTK